MDTQGYTIRVNDPKVALELYKAQDDIIKWTYLYLRHTRPELFPNSQIKAPLDIGQFDKGKRRYFITITDSKDDFQHVYDCFQRIILSKSLSPHNWLASWELTKAGRPHIHLLIDTDGYPRTRDIIKWNAGDGVDVQKVKDLQKTVDYILKGSEAGVDIINYLRKNKLSQFMYKNADRLEKEET